MRKLLHVAAIAATIVAAPFVAETTARAQVIEGCQYNDTEGEWVYPDQTPCRGTGEDPTVDSHGSPACALGRLAVLHGDRVTCVDLTGHGHGGGGHRKRHA